MARRDPFALGSPLPEALRLRGGSAAAALSLALVACGSSPGSPDAAVDAPAGPTWWQPQADLAKNWDIQLSAPIDVSTPRLMYDLDLWELVPSQTMLDYGDGAPVTVPPGSLAGTIAQLHARTPPTIVICHVDTGALDVNRPDAGKFPQNVRGELVPGGTTERFLDIREASRAKWAPIMFKRFDLARQIGCDGVEPARNDVASYNGASGFTISSEESYSWYAEVAKQGHARMLSTGMKNGDLLSGQTDMEADKFDWLMTERCGEFEQCDNARPFLNLHKPVFAIDYDMDSGDSSAVPPVAAMPQAASTVCPKQAASMINDGLYKDVALTSKVRVQCVPDAP